MALTSGTHLGPYEILEPLGAGGMGEVYRARDPRLGRHVALKVLPTAHSSDPRRLRRFEDEARAVAALDHPHILAVHDVGVDGDTPSLVFELLEGRTFREVLAGGPLPPRKVVDYAVQICRGLEAAHAWGIVHRDLKPANLFLTADGQVKILDFGLAKLQEPAEGPGSQGPTRPTETKPDAVLGTVGYMSPEQARGKPADARSDLFCLGTVLYEMLSGRSPFLRETAADTLSASSGDVVARPVEAPGRRRRRPAAAHPRANGRQLRKLVPRRAVDLLPLRPWWSPADMEDSRRGLDGLGGATRLPIRARPGRELPRGARSVTLASGTPWSRGSRVSRRWPLSRWRCPWSEASLTAGLTSSSA
jgi:serine/threonine protein kinase